MPPMMPASLSESDLSHAEEVFANDVRVLKLIDKARAGNIEALRAVAKKLADAGEV